VDRRSGVVRELLGCSEDGFVGERRVEGFWLVVIVIFFVWCFGLACSEAGVLFGFIWKSLLWLEGCPISSGALGVALVECTWKSVHLVRYPASALYFVIHWRPPS